MWPAHAVTLLRIPIAVAFWLAYGSIPAMVALVLAAAASDAADGNLARALKRRGASHPDIGHWLDPLVDKIFVALVVVAIGVHTHAWVAMLLVGARELALVPLVAIYVARYGARRLHADVLGKLATIAQFLALVAIVVDPDRAIVYALAPAILGLAATVHYVIALSREMPRSSSAASPAVARRSAP